MGDAPDFRWWDRNHAATIPVVVKRLPSGIVEVVMDERSEQTPIEPYTEPVLVEVGTFSQDTLGMGFLEPDFIVGTQG
ncbi:hypothetical protein GCM10010470_23740 [Saccharopolyspora taberi]|uniref:Uncharacterized protein n=1 Tax=Saccharopolyspora taberi TaxID=60895 RepID=A0ABN3VB81_9PSEU